MVTIESTDIETAVSAGGDSDGQWPCLNLTHIKNSQEVTSSSLLSAVKRYLHMYIYMAVIRKTFLKHF